MQPRPGGRRAALGGADTLSSSGEGSCMVVGGGGGATGSAPSTHMLRYIGERSKASGTVLVICSLVLQFIG